MKDKKWVLIMDYSHREFERHDHDTLSDAAEHFYEINEDRIMAPLQGEIITPEGRTIKMEFER